MDRNLFLALTLSATFQCLAQTPEPFEVRRAEAVFEELPELKASEIIKPELLKGPHFVVRDPVPTGAGMNQFTIDSDFGVFEADGNEMLYQDHAIATDGLSFPELKQRSLINERARGADQDPDFSRIIRERLPRTD